jgi:predicted component of type VI protein secretion system
MIGIPVDVLIDGVVRTLIESVLPDVTTRFARGQLWAAVDVLRNLRDRIEPSAALDDAEAVSATDALRRAAAALPDAARARVDATLAAAPDAPPAARVAALRAGLTAALEVIDDLPVELAGPARAAIHEHLAAQVMRDLAVLKPSLLGEISKG